jgi:hypothetical protein
LHSGASVEHAAPGPSAACSCVTQTLPSCSSRSRGCKHRLALPINSHADFTHSRQPVSSHRDLDDKHTVYVVCWCGWYCSEVKAVVMLYWCGVMIRGESNHWQQPPL